MYLLGYSQQNEKMLAVLFYLDLALSIKCQRWFSSSSILCYFGIDVWVVGYDDATFLLFCVLSLTEDKQIQ